MHSISEFNKQASSLAAKNGNGGSKTHTILNNSFWQYNLFTKLQSHALQLAVGWDCNTAK
jgi:hypothetical protein